MINVDNVLDYKREDLEKLSDEQLKRLLHDVNDKADELFTLQQTNKILINGLYGAQGNKNFILFNEKIAQAITGNGRYFIQLIANNINRILSEKLGKEYEFVNMGDTDSVYYRIEPFVELYKKEHLNADIGEIVQFCDDFEEQYIQPIIQNTIDEFSNTLNAYNPSKISAKKEIVSDCLHSHTQIRMKIKGKMKITSLGIFFNSRDEMFKDLSNDDVYVMSYNENTHKNELKKVLNVQRKYTHKRFVELKASNVGKIVCTEDHKIAVRVENKIIWKEAKYITEDDDVIVNENKCFSRSYYEDWGLEYISC